MLSQEPEQYGWLAYLGMMIFAGWGALVSYMHKVRNGRHFKWSEVAIDVFCSAFVGLVTGLSCMAAGLPMLAVFALVGMAGHMGPRFIGLLIDRAIKV